MHVAWEVPSSPEMSLRNTLKHRDAFPEEGKALKLCRGLPEICVTVKRELNTQPGWVFLCDTDISENNHNQVPTQEIFVKFHPEHSKMLWQSCGI